MGRDHPGRVAGRDRRVIARARRRLRVARYWQAVSDLEQAVRAAERALRLARSCPAAPVTLLADIALSLARVEADRDEYAASHAHLEYCLGLLDPAPASADRDRLLAWTLLALADGHRRAGRYRQATQALDRALHLAETGQVQPGLLTAVLNLLGITAKELGRYDRAAACYARVQEVHREHGAAPAEAATLQHNLAGLDYARRRYPQAESHARHALALRRRTPGATPTDLAADQAVLASALAAQHRHDQARELLHQALAACRAARPPRRYEIAVHLHNLADIEHTTGHSERAEDLYRQTLALKEDLLGPEHPEVALVTNNLATLLHQQHRHHEAAGHYQRALTIAEHTYPPDHPTTTAIRHHLRQLTPP